MALAIAEADLTARNMMSLFREESGEGRVMDVEEEWMGCWGSAEKERERTIYLHHVTNSIRHYFFVVAQLVLMLIELFHSHTLLYIKMAGGNHTSFQYILPPTLASPLLLLDSKPMTLTMTQAKRGDNGVARGFMAQH